MYWNFDDVEDGPEIIKGWITLKLSFEFPCHLAFEEERPELTTFLTEGIDNTENGMKKLEKCLVDWLKAL